MNGKTLIRALLVGAALTLAGAGCSSASGSSASVTSLTKVDGLEKTTLNVSVLPAIDSAGFFVAMHEGLFAQEGLQVNYTPAFGSGESIAGMVKGQYDITGVDYVSYIQAQVSHQADLRIFAEGSLLQPGSQVIMAMPHSGIKTLADLKGRVLGQTRDANIGFLLVASVLTADGISVGSVKYPHDPNFPFPPIGPLVSGQVAAAHLTEPFATELADQAGATTIADLDTGPVTQFPIAGYAVTKAWARSHPNTLRAFTAALEAGQEISDTNRPAVEAAFEALKPGEGHVDRMTAAQVALSSYPIGVTPVRLQRVPDVMRQFGFLSRPFDIRQLLD